MHVLPCYSNLIIFLTVPLLCYETADNILVPLFLQVHWSVSILIYKLIMT